LQWSGFGTSAASPGVTDWLAGDTALTTVTIGNEVEVIPASLFDGCSSITGALTIPASVITIGDTAFRNCSGLTSVTIGDGCTYIGKFAFCYCTGLTSLTIGNAVTYIDRFAFNGCTGLTGALTIPNSVTDLQWGAFHYCSGLTSVTIPNSVIHIGAGVFANCTNLASVVIGNSVDTLGTQTFANDVNLSKITSLNTTPPSYMGNNVFENVPTGIPVHVLCGSIADYQAAAQWSDFTNYVGIPFVVSVSSNSNTMGTATVTQTPSCANNNQAIIQATANSGYHFVNWSDNSTYNPYTFTLTEDVALTAIFAADDVTGITDVDNSNDINIYPNPVTSELIIENAELKIGDKIEIFNVLGQIQQSVIVNQQSTIQKMDVSTLANGVYFIKVLTDKGIATKKIIVE
jgi:hypothetical protein